MKKKLLSGLLSLVLFFSLFCGTTITTFAAWALPASVDVFVDDQTDPYTLHGYTVEGYDFYLLKDIAHIFSDTAKPFDIVEDGNINLIRGEAYHDEGHVLLSQRPDVIDGAASFVTQNYYLDGGRKVTYSVAKVDGEIFMRLADVLQMFNIYGIYDYDEEAMIFNTAKPFTTKFETASEHDYFDYLHGATIGDGSGNIYASFHGSDKVAIASTTKIMTFLLVMEAIDNGVISLEDRVTITAEGARLSRTDDRVLRDLQIGAQIPLTELLDAMLVVSSNEAATLLGEHVAGTETNFVARMNQRARQLGLHSAEFYNSHGLPVYTSHVFASKLQNRMTANDLYQLTAYVLGHYPEILKITSKESIVVNSTDGNFSYTGSTTNRLLFQMEDVDGLKTGTTNRSGACHVATMSLDPENGDPEQRFIAVVLGAEDNLERYWKSGILLEYAKETYLANTAGDAAPAEETDGDGVPLTDADGETTPLTNPDNEGAGLSDADDSSTPAAHEDDEAARSTDTDGRTAPLSDTEDKAQTFIDTNDEQTPEDLNDSI